MPHPTTRQFLLYRPSGLHARRSRHLALLFGVGLLTVWLSLPTGLAAAQEEPPGPWSAADFVWPLSATDQVDLPITSPYGPRLQGSQAFAYDYHRGIDIQAPVGTPIYAVADGTIRISGEHPAYRDMLVQLRMVRAGQPTLYANYTHLSEVVVAEDQQVNQGDLLGYTGVSESGFAHLHFEIREGGLYQRHARNPISYLPYPDTTDHEATIDILATSSSEDGSGRDVVVSVRAVGDELDIDSVQLSVHAEQQLDSPPPSDLTALSEWEFGFQQLNFDQTPIIDGSSDITILDEPVVILDPDTGTSVLISPGRYDGRNPPWDIATYEFTFRGVPLPDPAAVPFHLAATVNDTRNNPVTTWSSPTQPQSFGPTGSLAFHRGAGASQDLLLVWPEPLDPANELTADEVSCTAPCAVAITAANPAAGVYEVTIDPEPGEEDLVVTVAPGALTDTSGRPTSQVSTRFTLDNWAPEVIGTIDVAPNAAGWIQEPATISWTAVDPEPSSGFAAPELADSTVDQLGAHTYLTATLCDVLNNCRPGSFTIGFDNIAPEITITGGPGPDSEVTEDELSAPTCSALDEHSGVDDAGCEVTTNSTFVDATTQQVTAMAMATDVAGNTTLAEWTFDVTDVAPRARLVFQSIAEDLATFAASAADPELAAEDLEDILDAVADLQLLDEDRNWLDDKSFDDTRGPTAYRIAQSALRSVDHIGEVETAIATQRLVETLRDMSMARIESAGTANGDPDLVSRARARMATGDTFGAMERWSRASTYYRYAWYWARQAARAPVEPANRT